MFIKTKWLASFFFMCGVQGTLAADFDYYLTGNAGDVQTARTEGARMLMGGGGRV